MQASFPKTSWHDNLYHSNCWLTSGSEHIIHFQIKWSPPQCDSIPVQLLVTSAHLWIHARTFLSLDSELLRGLKIQASRGCALTTGVNEVVFCGACVITNRRIIVLLKNSNKPHEGDLRRKWAKNKMHTVGAGRSTFSNYFDCFS